MFCASCGNEVNEGVNFCPKCGKDTGAASPVQQTGAGGQDNSKTMSILAYILFFIPLATGAHKTSPVVKFHTNQGTVLFITLVAYSIISAILRAVITVRREVVFLGIQTGEYIKLTPWWLNTILWIGSIGISVLCVIGIVNAIKERTKELPLIGKFQIIK